MKIYISASWVAKERLQERAHQLRLIGHTVTSSWLHESLQPENLTIGQWHARLASKDIAEVFSSDCIILDLDDESTTGGCHTEWGVACHPNSVMLRYTVGGTKQRIFTQLADEHYEHWEQLLAEFPRNKQ
jgi:nucleoside 2-deoxyribosyltransferase